MIHKSTFLFQKEEIGGQKGMRSKQDNNPEDQTLNPIGPCPAPWANHGEM